MSSIVKVELALQVYCNLVFEDNTLCRFWRGGVVLPKGFSPPENLCVMFFLSPSTFLLAEIFFLHCFESVSVKFNRICILLPLRN